MILGAVVVLIVLAGVTRYVHGVSSVVAFVFSTLALAGVAWVVALSIEQVGRRVGPSVTGVMQATVANLPEFFVVIFALRAGQQVIAETAILGSILVNALLVLGLVIIAGARRERDGIMRFSPKLPNDTATLLLVASFIIVLIGLDRSSDNSASRHAETISIIGACVILAVYATWLRQYLTNADVATPENAEPPRLSLSTSIVLLLLAGTASAFVSDWFVARAATDDREAPHLTGVRRLGDRRDRRQRRRERGRDRARPQGPVRARDLDRQELGLADRRVPVIRCSCSCRC